MNRLSRIVPRLAVLFVIVGAVFLSSSSALWASEADLAIPDLKKGSFQIAGAQIAAWDLLFYGSFVIAGTLGISLYLRRQIYSLPAHKSMLDIAEIIFQTCKTYLIQQGKFLLMLFVLLRSLSRTICWDSKARQWS